MNYREHIIKWNKYYIKNKTKVSWGFDKQDSHILDFLDFYNFKNNLNVLDVGCGYGKNANIFIYKGLNYTGIDISKEPIEYAKKNILAGNFVLGNIITYNFGNKFDVIIDAGCIHVNNKIDALNIIKKYQFLIQDKGFIFIRIFKSNFVSNEPLFIIDGELPVWGYREDEIVKIFGKFFIIDKIILDKDYYEEDEVFYLYLRAKIG